MSVLMPLTLQIAIAFGLYVLAGSLGLLLSAAERRARLFEEMAGSPGLVFAYGVIAFAVGAVWVMVHGDWMTPLGILISLCGWILAIEGVLLLAIPGVMVRVALAFRPVIVPCCIVGVIAGLLLILAGFTGVADAGGSIPGPTLQG